MKRRRAAMMLAGAMVTATGACGLWRQPVTLPDAPAGDERVERRSSPARGREVDFYTAVPAGYGDGRGLPVCLVLHGGSKRPPDFPGLGLGRFLTDAVRRGAAPFVLAGATGDRLAWRPHGDDDPLRMVREEIPAWCAERGFDTTRIAAWGWSMGGSGSLLLAETHPDWVRAVAAFSPAVTPGDDIFTMAGRLSSTPVGLWCGEDDSLLDAVKALPITPAAGGYQPGNHNFAYWSTVIPEAFSFLSGQLTPA